jgi:flagellar basal body-associated protein FliL
MKSQIYKIVLIVVLVLAVVAGMVGSYELGLKAGVRGGDYDPGFLANQNMGFTDFTGSSNSACGKDLYLSCQCVRQLPTKGHNGEVRHLPTVGP